MSTLTLLGKASLKATHKPWVKSQESEMITRLVFFYYYYFIRTYLKNTKMELLVRAFGCGNFFHFRFVQRPILVFCLTFSPVCRCQGVAGMYCKQATPRNLPKDFRLSVPTFPLAFLKKPEADPSEIKYN